MDIAVDTNRVIIPYAFEYFIFLGPPLLSLAILPTLHMLHGYITTVDDKEEDCHTEVSPSSPFPRNCVS